MGYYVLWRNWHRCCLPKKKKLKIMTIWTAVENSFRSGENQYELPVRQNDDKDTPMLEKVKKNQRLDGNNSQDTDGKTQKMKKMRGLTLR